MRGCLVALMAFSIGVSVAVSAQRAAPPLRLLHTTLLPHVRGRIDHFDDDLAGQRLFMSALGNNTVEVFDLRSGAVVYTIRGLTEPQGVTFAPASDRLFVANGGDGTVRIFDGSNYRLLKTVRLGADADDTRYDAARGQVWVGYGDGSHSGLAVLDGASGQLQATIPLPGHPESFQLQRNGPLIFVNIPTAGNIVDVVNRQQLRVVATWKLDGARDNFPMALDEANQRLFLVCRAPAELLVLDTKSGRIVARLPAVAHADDVWYGARHRRIYISGGAGALTVIGQRNANHYAAIASIATPRGGRTSLLVPELERYYLGIWGRGGQVEALRIYQILP